MKETIYLTRDESNIIKGILILLIVLGHNHFLMDYKSNYTNST